MQKLLIALQILLAYSFVKPLQRCPRRAINAANAAEDLTTLKVPQLKQLLKERGLKVSGKKQDLIDRLREHSPAEDEPEDESLFATISSHVAEMGSLGPAQSLSLHLALLRLALHAYPARLGYVDRTLGASVSLLSAAAEVSPDVAALAEEAVLVAEEVLPDAADASPAQ